MTFVLAAVNVVYPVVQSLATKDDLKDLAKKKDLDKFVTKKELTEFGNIFGARVTEAMKTGKWDNLE